MQSIHRAPWGSSDGLVGISKSWKFEKKDVSLLSVVEFGDIIDVIKEPTNHIVIAFRRANRSEEIIESPTINL